MVISYEMMNILGENYEEVSGKDAVLWRGDLFVFDESCGVDCKAYMLCISEDRKGFRLVNYVGYKAGAQMTTVIPMEASQSGAMNVRLSWLLDNWSDVIPIGSFATTKFFKWMDNQVV